MPPPRPKPQSPTSELFDCISAELVHDTISVRNSLDELVVELRRRGADKFLRSPVLGNCLRAVADPARTISLLTLLIKNSKGKPRCAALLDPTTLPQLLALLSYSPGLGNYLLKYPKLIAEIFPVTKERPAIMAERLQTPTPHINDKSAQMKWLRQLKIREYIRIAICDHLALDSFVETTEKISLLADVCVSAAIQFSGLHRYPVAVIAMGKWGGNELNYSSDIDLFFVAANTIQADTLGDIHRKTVETISLLNAVTEDGFVFRIDNRLRPEGASGALVRTLDQMLVYYQKRAVAWEFQALIKARCSGGDRTTGDAFITAARPLVYNLSADPEAVLQQVRVMKEKIETALITRHTHKANVKLGVGGIRDIEFIVQFLQLHHGRMNANLREMGTVTAIDRLAVHRIITTDERKTLLGDYVFLRDLEHCLQIANELPIRQLPKDRVELEILGRKMGFRSTTRKSSGIKLQERYQTSILRTRQMFHDLFDMTLHFLENKKQVRILCPEVAPDIIDSHFRRLESDYFLTFTPGQIARHIRMIDSLTLKRLCEIAMDQHPNGMRTLTIVAYDCIGQFAKICGLFAAYGQNIVNGESFTYAPNPSKETQSRQREFFYRRPRRRYYGAILPSSRANADDRKIVCVANLRPNDTVKNTEFPLREFHDELAFVFALLRDQKFDEASERITLRVIRSLPPAALQARQLHTLLPIKFTFDNTSDQTYTILDIVSTDQFMFLFEFCNALASRNYYIGKVEFNTDNETVRDRLFITTREGRKIVSKAKQRSLQETITLIKQFAAFLARAPNPQLALKQFGDLVESATATKTIGKVVIAEHTEIMESLARILGTSVHLWEHVVRIQHENLIQLLAHGKTLDRSHSVGDLKSRLALCLKTVPTESEKIDALNLFKDKEMFRIDLRHLTGRVKQFSDFSGELADLADVLLTRAYQLAVAHAERKMGCREPGAAAIFALGKWGGRELGYASDIELLLIWDANQTEQEKSISFYETVAQFVANAIRSKQDGIFELDFRLRPGGKSAHLATSFTRFTDYFSAGGGADPYECQALIRLRPVAGNPSLMRRVETHRRNYVFGRHKFDINRIFQLRQRQQTELVRPSEINAKFSPGGLVDAEYFVQILQIRHGASHRNIQSPNTLEAAKALYAGGFIDSSHYARLNSGYRFLRALINGLRIVRGNAKDLVLPPPNSPEFEFLIRRIESFGQESADKNAWEFIRQQMASIHELFTSLA